MFEPALLDQNITLLKQWKGYQQAKHLTDTLKSLKSKQSTLNSIQKNERSYNLVLSHLQKYLSTFLNDYSSKTRIKPKHLDNFTVLESKLKIVLELLDLAQTVPENDLCCQDKSSPRWSRINSVVTTVTPKNKEKLKRQYKDFIQLIILSQAFVSTGLQESSKFKRNLMVGLSAMYYFFNRKKADHQKSLSYATCDPQVARTTWNLMDSWICSKAMNIVLAPVEENLVIYIPRTAPHVLTGKSIEVSAEFSLTYKEGYIPVRLLHSSLLVSEQKENNAGMCCGPREKKGKRPSSVIFHIHGGGFISMSSNSHQVYTRRWVQDLKVPVFSVDYRLAPKNAFPDGLDNVWQAYFWLVHNSGSLNMKIKKILVTGDSAGGNLALGVTNKAILEGIKKPDGLVLVYPALYLHDKAFKDSLMLCLEDNVMPYSFMKLCKELYVQDSEFDCGTNFWISPLVAGDELIRQLPRVRIVFGEDDPLVDYSFWFIERLLDNEVDVKGSLFEETPHGALNFYVTGGVKKARKFYEATLGYFSELISR